jgi:tetratricopeptide (TPR) repeat protein
MSDNDLFPEYITRHEEQLLRTELAKVAEEGNSRAVLLYGPGGVGKTSLVRHLAETSKSDDSVAWLDPIDVDDPDFWLLSNLERNVVNQLDPDGRYFGPYLGYLSQLPSYTQPRIAHESVVSHLGRIKRVFVDCYRDYVEGTGKSVVMVFDTVEAIRGVYLLYTLTQWIKALPATLFVLCGRPPAAIGDRDDPIRSELEDPYQNLPVTEIRLGEFTQEAALEYIRSSSVAAGLTADEQAKVVLLTGGHPLWLALAISYVLERGIPQEAEEDLASIERQMPYGDMTDEGEDLHEAFKRRLLTPYREVDFWHEAVKRLAVVRQSVNQQVWERLMSDRGLPADAADWNEAWLTLLDTPWIRTRVNGRYATLHDGIAEELAQRIVPLHDQDRTWRAELWARAASIYRDLSEDPQEERARRITQVNEGLHRSDEILTADPDALTPQEQAARNELIEEAVRLDGEKREIDQFRAVSLYYGLLSDFTAGSAQVLDWFEESKKQDDVFFQDRIALELQRILPSGPHSYALGDIVGGRIDEFRNWLEEDGRQFYLDIGLSLAGYLVDNEQAPQAVRLLTSLPEDVADSEKRSMLAILKGNAHMRIPEEAGDAEPFFHRGLVEAQASTSSSKQRYIADAYKELGFYYRNRGLWPKADEAYERARDAILENLLTGGSRQDHEAMASIQTNWAYIKGLNGSYRDGTNLVESAIKVRNRLGLQLEEGISWSVCGEVYRYERRFEKAWEAFAEAEQLFHGRRNWSWLGAIYQQQAICLFQAAQDDAVLIEARDPIEYAKRLITLALDICRDQNVRSYPSALNRAGRIFGQDDFDLGLRYLSEGIDWARRLSDGWFWFANLTEYVELSYRAWAATGEPRYRDEIGRRTNAIAQAMKEYEFLDLRGRWHLLRGHLGIHDALRKPDLDLLDEALENYKVGFALIAGGYVGSSGAASIADEFDRFDALFERLPTDVQGKWRQRLYDAWRGEQGANLLLARLEQLYY